MLLKQLSALTIAVVILFFSTSVMANLLISPTRVVIDSNEKTAQVALVNDSDQPQTYRLEFENKKVTENGAFVVLDQNTVAGFNRADTMIRVSPRQVSLQPREKQVIKLSIRRPRDLPLAEYRSYLRFVAIPPPPMLTQPEQGAATEFKLLMSFSIPVVVKNGSQNGMVSIAGLSRDTATKEQSFIVHLERTGNSSVFGNIRLYTLPDINGSKPVALLNEAAFYTDTNKRNIKLVTMPDTKLSPNGRYKVVIEGLGEKKGTVIATKEISIK